MEEIWKDIEGYEGLYQVSNFGRVRSFHCGKTKILNPKPSKQGYKMVSLCKNGISSPISIHRLVALAFVPGYAPTLVVNHKDEDTTNNAAENLEWVTSSYNTRYNEAHVKGRNKARYTELTRNTGIMSRQKDNVRRLASVLREHRIKIGLSQRNIADIVGITESIVGRFERCDYNPQIAFIFAYAEAVGMKLELINYSDEL